VSEAEIRIRPEEPRDHARVREIVAAAFGQPDEARLVDALRGRVDPEISLVAETPDGRVVGHIFFSPVHVGGDGRCAMGLAPVSVDPACQNAAIGSRLCREGLEACRALGEDVVFVLGHPSYYPRFGFQPARPHGLYYEDERFDGAFFVAELAPGALDGFRGEVRYHPAFDGL